MAFTVRWGGIGVGNNYAGLLITGDPTKFSIDWRDGTREKFKEFNRDFSGSDGVNDILYADHSFSRDGSYSVIVKHMVEATPVIRLNVLMAANADQPINQLPITNRDDLVVATRFADKFWTALGDDFVSGGDGNDYIDLGAGNDTFFGGRDNDIAFGRDGNDYLQGDEGTDIMIGQEGNDFLFGGSGNDELRGNEGYDRLEGGSGADLMTGGAGYDVFVFAPDGPFDEAVPPRTDVPMDTITDYKQYQDYLDVSGWGPLTWIGENGFSGNGNEIRFVELGRGTTVFADIDGDLTADFSFYIRQNVTLTPDDFIGGNVTLAI